jgi:hypothetical protein
MTPRMTSRVSTATDTPITTPIPVSVLTTTGLGLCSIRVMSSSGLSAAAQV